MNENEYSSPVAQLYNLGRKYLSVKEWPNYPELFGLTREHIPELIELLDFEQRWPDLTPDEEVDEKKHWAPVHAWRALGQLGGPDVVAPLLAVMNKTDELETDWVDDELPIALAAVGPVALPQLESFLDDRSHGLWARVDAVEAIARIGQEHPDVREDAIRALTRALEDFETNDDEFNAFIIYGLAQLKAHETAPLVKAAYDANRVDLFLMGDYQDFEIAVGLRKRKDRAPDGEIPFRNRRQTEKKRVNRRKMAKQSRRQQRKSKKKRKKKKKRK